MSVLAPGSPAPEFTLKTGEGKDFTRADLEGAVTVLVFYPFAFSPVCTDQFSLYEEILEPLAERGARMFGVSCDSPWSQSAFVQQLGVSIPQLSDFEPKGAACRAFGVYHAGVILALSAFGVPQTEALAFALVSHAVNFGALIVIGAVCLWREGLSLEQLIGSRKTPTDESVPGS